LSAALFIEGVVDRDVGWRSKARCPTTTSRWSAWRRRALWPGLVRPRKTHRRAFARSVKGPRKPLAPSQVGFTRLAHSI